jgi:hypothetical protein
MLSTDRVLVNGSFYDINAAFIGFAQDRLATPVIDANRRHTCFIMRARQILHYSSM